MAQGKKDAGFSCATINLSHCSPTERMDLFLRLADPGSKVYVILKHDLDEDEIGPLFTLEGGSLGQDEVSPGEIDMLCYEGDSSGIHPGRLLLRMDTGVLHVAGDVSFVGFVKAALATKAAAA